MKDILSYRSLANLAAMVRLRTLVAFDFDGTLAPIVSDRHSAAMRAGTRRLLATACRHYPIAIISGRSRRDVAGRLRGIPVAHVIGNHGLEPARQMGHFHEAVQQMRTQLVRALFAVPGCEIEDKRYSLAIHFRASTRRHESRAAILAAIERLPEHPRVVLGKAVVNVLPAGAPNKGTALMALREEEQVELVIFIGDDVTDEDVFALDHPGSLLGIRVGRSASSAAQYYLRGQREIDQLIEQLIRFRLGTRAASFSSGGG